MAFGFIPTWLIVGVAMLVVLVILFRSMDRIYILSMVTDHFFYFFAFLVFIFFAFSLMHLNAKYDLDLKTMKGWSTDCRWFIQLNHMIASELKNIYRNRH